MNALGSAAVFLLASHFGIACSRRRDVLVRRLGGRGYLGSYSLVTLVAFAGLVAACRRAPLDVVWIAPDALKLALAPIMVPAFVLAVAGLTTPNPTIVGAERLFDRPDCVRGILRVTRNPFLWGSGVVGSGSRDRDWRHRGDPHVRRRRRAWARRIVVLDERKGRKYPIEWARFASLSSNVPFAAIIGAVSASRLARSDGGDSCSSLCSSAAPVAGHRWAFDVVPLPTCGML
jgi:uncharacterized membrane protein